MNKPRSSWDYRAGKEDYVGAGGGRSDDLLGTEQRAATPGDHGQLQPARQPVSERFPALEEQEIVFSLLAPEAGSVFVVGEFNGWCIGATPLSNTGLGSWGATVMLRSGIYEYRFVVDGRWCEDPDESRHVPNSLGSYNSVLGVPLALRTSLL